MQQRILQQGKAVGSEDRSTAAALVLEVRAAMYLRSAMLQLLLNSLLVHRLKRQIWGCFSLQTLQEGTCNFSCSLENRESLSGGEVRKSLLLDALWLSYTPCFGHLEIRLVNSRFNLLVPFAGRITPWAGANWHSCIGSGEGSVWTPWLRIWPPMPQLLGAGTLCARAKYSQNTLSGGSRSSPRGRLVTTKPRAPPETETVSALSKQLS